MSARAAFANDLRLQWRHGFFAAYAVVIAVYIILIRQLPAEARAIGLVVLTFTELSVIGFFFAGALLMLERGDGVLHALAVTPLRTARRLGARAAAFVCLGVAAVAPLVLLSGAAFRPLPLAAALAWTTTLFTLLGTWAGARFATIDRFVVFGGLLSTVLGLPALALVPALDSPAWGALPTYGTLVLLSGAFTEAAPSLLEWLYAMAALTLAVAAAAQLAVQALQDRAGRG